MGRIVAMERQHTENLFRRYKGQLVNIKSLSGGVYKGYVVEVTNDYVSLSDRDTEDQTHTFILFPAIESVVVIEAS
jgi:phenolic acid decarboxylase